MSLILSTYLEYKNWIEFVKDVAFFLGTLAFFRTAYAATQYLKAKKFNEVTQVIQNNLKFRERFELPLNDYLFDRAKHSKDIALRLVYWKNYPWNLSNDGFKKYLHINYFDNQPHYGWIDNTSIYFYEWPAYYGLSIYIDKHNVFFFANKGLSFKGFTELPDCYYVVQLPFINIINFDFRERIEYEPVIYIKYPYNSPRLLTKSILIINREPKDYFRLELSAKNKIQKNSRIKYAILKFKYICLAYLASIKSRLTKH